MIRKNLCVVLLLFITLGSLIQLYDAQTGPVISLSNAEKQIVLDVHNKLRGALNAKNMAPMVWLDSLCIWGTNAVTHKCAWAETPQSVRTNVAGYKYVGENIAAGSISDIGFLMSGWVSEKQLYTYGPMSLNNFLEIGHYTQQVWANSVAIGCVVINCTQSNPAVNFMIACNYGPGGNYIGQYPYTVCPSGTTCNLITPSPGGSVISLANPSASSTNTPSRSRAAPSSTPSPTPSPSCAPRRCSSNSCGTISNGCGGSINCGSCSSGSNCVNNVCVACQPTATCSNKQCGTVNNGCGTTLNCGSCSSGQICENYACTANPICQSCAQANANCGTITITGCPTQSCGSCSAGFTCNNGKCTVNNCGKCPVNSACVNGLCQCLDGYQNNTGSGCVAIPVIPSNLLQTYSSAGNGSFDWVYRPQPGNLTGTTYSIPQIDAITTSNTRLTWIGANSYSSTQLTTFSASILFASSSSLVGLGLRANQGPGRDMDSLQWNLDTKGSVTWYLTWFNRLLNQGSYGTVSNFNPNTWNNFTVSIYTTSSSGISYATSTVSVNGAVVVRAQPVRPYDQLGGAYLYTSGPSSWRNLSINTATSLRTLITNCLSASQWAALVSKALNIPASKVTLVNVTVSGVCVGQATGKRRQAAAVVGADTIGNTFLFTLSSTEDIGSRALASQFIELANTWDDTMADTGGVQSVEYVTDPSVIPPFETPDMANAVDLQTLDTGAGTGGTGGLSGGAIAGIVIGSVVGAVILGVVALAVIGGIAYIVYNKTKSEAPGIDISTAPVQTTEYYHAAAPAPAVVPVVEKQVYEEEGRNMSVLKANEVEEDEDEGKPRGAVDVYHMDARHHQSLSARVPEGYLPDGTLIREVEEEEEESTDD